MMRSAMTIEANGNDCIKRIRSSIGEALDVMHFQLGLVLHCHKRDGSTTAYTSPATTLLGVVIDPLASLT